MGTGAAWQPEEVRVNGHSYFGYTCNLFSGGLGSLEFVLGKLYRELVASVGFEDGSTPTAHTVRFQIIADGQEYLFQKDLRFGETEDLKVSVTGVTNLRLTVTETTHPVGSTAPSQPVFAQLALTPL